MTVSDQLRTDIGTDLSRDAALRRATAVLTGTSGPEAALDARILLEAATNMDRAALLRDGDRPLGADAAARFRAMLARRLGGEPVWRILGTREFWGLPFAITPEVLDPRPDTETVVAATLEAVRGRRGETLRILDLGVGSGAILAALLHELPRAQGWGVDRSIAACRVARRNIEALGLIERALVFNGDWSEALPAGGFDLVVSNPPYIETDVIPTLSPEVQDFDPRSALDGGPDGLGCYRAIMADLPRLLAPGGTAALEIGAGQGAVVAALLADAGLAVRAVHRDLGGHERALVAGAGTRP